MKNKYNIDSSLYNTVFMTENITPDNTEENVTQVTPDNTEETSAERQDISEVGKNFEESSRNAKLADKEANKYAQFVNDGEIDYDGIKDIYRGNTISDAALTKFCEAQGISVDEAKSNLVDQNDEIAELKRQLEEAQNRAPEPTFTDTLKAQIESSGLSEQEFLKYKDEFEEELEDLTGLPTDKAIAKALKLVVRGGSTVRVAQTDAKIVTGSNVWSKDKYMNYVRDRSKVVGNDVATSEHDAYEAERKAKGEPLYK